MNQRSGTPSAISKVHAATIQKTDCCSLCSNEHSIDICDTFKKITVNSRYAKAKQLGLCFLCLKRGHRTTNCKSDSSKWCECKGKHHPLMHSKDKESKENSTEEAANKTTTDQAIAGSSKRSEEPRTVAKCEVPSTPTVASKQVLLATAIVEMVGAGGVKHNCRALLNSGAMANFVSESMCDILSLPKSCANVPIVGVNGTKMNAMFKINATVKSKTTDYESSIDYLVVPRVTGALPSLKLNSKNWPIPTELQLADPKFFIPSRIDILLGAEVFFDLLQVGKIRMSTELPILQESRLGWPIYNVRSVTGVQNCHASSSNQYNEQLNDLMKRFWMIDEQIKDQLEGDECESHFISTYFRGEDGRYVVKLPFRKDAGELGDSRTQAEKRFKALEARLEKYPDTKQKYKGFIYEFISLGHARIL
ncbi:uncharacterized protein LOC129720455 [Wyeomyia smithii]|uniref:uncharacterized protein LOC129720455 n=1 Tax=Wyeomyia smithii TaxID=174621 RepID=UPI002467E007|nr:uncharacterized protein LOC129720455 [Wyeomyia smithii]